MTVRANKPAFNIREKLKELTQSIGLKGRELMRAATVQDARDLISAGRKNMVINGDMRISQRVGTTSTNVTNGNYILDRYRWDTGTAGSMTAQQVTDAPPGFHNSMKLTVTGTDTSIASGDYHYFRHIIEGNNINHLNWGSSNAKTVTLSFWVKSSVAGDHGGSLWNDGFDRSFPFNYTINSANVWEHKSITVPGCPDGTWETGTDRGIAVAFTQLSGSTYTGSANQWNGAGDIAPTTHVNLLATNGATWYITGVQLEVGKNATEFEHRSYGEELALCQRYYLRLNSQGNNDPIANVYGEAGSQVYGTFHFPVQMRVAPTFTYSATNHFTVIHAGTVTGGPTMFNSTLLTAGIGANTAGSGTLAATGASQLRFTTGAGWIAFAAEL